MTKEQAADIMQAMNRLADTFQKGKQEIGSEEFGCQGEGYPLSTDDIITLDPFLYAKYEKRIAVGDCVLKKEGEIGTEFICHLGKSYINIPDEQLPVLADIITTSIRLLLLDGHYKRTKLSDLYGEDVKWINGRPQII